MGSFIAFTRTLELPAAQVTTSWSCLVYIHYTLIELTPDVVVDNFIPPPVLALHTEDFEYDATISFC